MAQAGAKTWPKQAATRPKQLGGEGSPGYGTQATKNTVATASPAMRTEGNTQTHNQRESARAHVSRKGGRELKLCSNGCA